MWCVTVTGLTGARELYFLKIEPKSRWPILTNCKETSSRCFQLFSAQCSDFYSVKLEYWYLCLGLFHKHRLGRPFLFFHLPRYALYHYSRKGVLFSPWALNVRETGFGVWAYGVGYMEGLLPSSLRCILAWVDVRETVVAYQHQGPL